MLKLIFELLFTIPLVFFSKEERINRILKKTISTNIKNSKDGDLIKVVGKAQAFQKQFTSPISRKACFYFHIIVNQQKSDYIDDIINEKKGIPFIVESNGVKCLIKPNFSESVLKHQTKLDSGILQNSSLEVKSYLKSKGYSTKSFGIKKSLEVIESIVQTNDTIAVYGKGKWVTQKSTGEKVYVLSVTKKTPIYISNQEEHFK